MMNDKDIKEYHDLDKLKQYNPLPSGIVVADSVLVVKDYSQLVD